MVNGKCHSVGTREIVSEFNPDVKVGGVYLLTVIDPTMGECEEIVTVTSRHWHELAQTAYTFVKNGYMVELVEIDHVDVVDEEELACEADAPADVN